MGTLHYIDEEVDDDPVTGSIDDIEFYGVGRRAPRYTPVLPTGWTIPAANDNPEGAPAHADRKRG